MLFDRIEEILVDESVTPLQAAVIRNAGENPRL